MKKELIACVAVILSINAMCQIAPPESYLNNIREELNKKWPDNRTINIVFHGHSVPSGYFVTPDVRPFESYPMLTQQSIKTRYPYAVVNTIVTAIGGENAIKGEQRFKSEVLCHRPDVVLIDYALNDRWEDFQQVKLAWESMIKSALEYGCKVILLTPTPDAAEEILDDNSRLQKHADMIVELATKYKIGLVDSYSQFKSAVKQGAELNSMLSQSNHPNKIGHQMVSDIISDYF